MAFTTEFVAAAQAGPETELITGERTTGGNTGPWTSTLALPAGQWLVVIRGRFDSGSQTSTNEQQLQIDGVTRFMWKPESGRCVNPTASAIVSGGRNITLAHTANTTISSSHRLGGSLGWDFYAARIG